MRKGRIDHGAKPPQFPIFRNGMSSKRLLSAASTQKQLALESALETGDGEGVLAGDVVKPVVATRRACVSRVHRSA
jgi:hypothetical protein